MNGALVSDLLFGLTSVLYLIASVLFGISLSGSTRLPAAVRAAPLFIAAGATLHAAHIVTSSLVFRVCPVEGMHFTMNVVSLLACSAYVFMRTRFRIDILGAFVAPLALTFILGSRVIAAGREPLPHLRGAISFIHLTAIHLSLALFMLASAAAVTYLLQESRLKQKRLIGLFQRLPPLDALDRAEHRFLLAGFPLLTVGILTGTLWARTVESSGGVDLLRSLFGFATWLMFAAVLLLRAAAGWRGRRAAIGTLAGFSVAVLVLLLYLVRSASSSA